MESGIKSGIETGGKSVVKAVNGNENEKRLLFLSFYPDLMNLYGGYANLLILRRLMERLGRAVTVREITPGETPDLSDLSQADFVFMGAGTERRQKFAMDDFIRYSDLIKNLAADDTPMLFSGNSMELCGKNITTADGEIYHGIGLAGFETVQRARRITGDVYGYMNHIPGDSENTAETPYRIQIVGFMNKSGIISGVETPLLNILDMGFGNEFEKGPEGFQIKNIIGSELTGPILVKNPCILEKIAAAIFTRRGLPLPDEWPIDPWARNGYDVTVRELDARCHKR